MKKTTVFSLLVLSLNFSNVSRATIIYSDVADQTLTAQGSINVDFNSDGTPEFTFSDMGSSSIEPGIFFADQNHHLTTVSAAEWDVLRGVTFGTVINASVGFFDMGDAYIDPFWGTTPFPIGDTYLGAQFTLGANTHFGWILVNWNGNGTFTIKSVAYESSPSTSINAGAMGSTGAGIQEIAESTLLLYPNPVGNLITVVLSENDATSSLKIVDNYGRTVKEIEVTDSKVQVDISSLYPGVYWLSDSGNTTTPQQFLKVD